MKFNFGAGLWPVVQRELRQAARRRWGFRLRMGAAIGGVLCYYSLFNSWDESQSQSKMAGQLFDKVHLLLLDLICAVVPALTADCLAREKREGTLGLLFLTPLSASGVVLGKILARTLQVLIVWMAVVPMLWIPLLIGDVTWNEVIVLLVFELCAGMLCLAAGVLASSLTESRPIAFILAYILAASFVFGAIQGQHWQMLGYARSLPPPANRPSPAPSYLAGPSTDADGIRFQSAGGGAVRAMLTGGLPAVFQHPPPEILAEDLTAASLALLAAIYFAGYLVERSWQDKIPPVWRQNWSRRGCAPFFSRWKDRGMRRTLEWNPIAWLQQYSWRARLSKWGLCLLFVVLECLVIDGKKPGVIDPLLTLLLVILAAAYTFAGINGFQQAKRSGALELILVSPLPVEEIIFGRVWGLWKQFLPSVLVLLVPDFAAHGMLYGPNSASAGSLFWMKEMEIIAIYLTLPIFATYFALCFKNLYVAAALTWETLLLPVAFGMSCGLPLDAPLLTCFIMAGGNVFMGLFALNLVQTGLARRSHGFS
jgi:ABC-type transport system involved in cytochrome c biogenesis permease component